MPAANPDTIGSSFKKCSAANRMPETNTCTPSPALNFRAMKIGSACSSSVSKMGARTRSSNSSKMMSSGRLTSLGGAPVKAAMISRNATMSITMAIVTKVCSSALRQQKFQGDRPS